MVNGVLYTTTPLGLYVAIDPGTGRTIWQYDPEIWKIGRPTNLGFTHRGTAYWTDGTRKRIISGTHDAHLVSLDAETGKPDPAFGDQRPRGCDRRTAVRAARPATTPSTPTPVVVRNVIITGANIVDRPLVKEQPRGDIFGFDARTGKKLWTFHSIPQKGEFGYDTWEDGSAEYTGNTNVWSLITADEETRLRLPAVRHADQRLLRRPPARRTTSSPRAWSVSTPATGRRVWHFQAVHHGLWDYDFPAAPILVDLTVNGRRIKAVAQVSKQGFVYVFDRKTGEPIYPIEERPVPPSNTPGERAAKTQPFPSIVPPFERQGFSDSTSWISRRSCGRARSTC